MAHIAEIALIASKSLKMAHIAEIALIAKNHYKCPIGKIGPLNTEITAMQFRYIKK